jgi:hypothetical protein
MKRRTVSLTYGIILIWIVLPLIPPFLASVVALSHRCTLNEADAHRCIVLGTDIGEALYVMFVVGWYALGTFPTGILALGTFSVVVWRRNRAADRHGGTGSESGWAEAKQDLVLWFGLASLLLSLLASIPALILAATGRPLATRAKVGVVVATITALGSVVVPVLARLLQGR